MITSATKIDMTNEGNKENPIDLSSIEDQVFDFTNDPDVIIASPTPRKIKRPKQLAATHCFGLLIFLGVG